MNDKPLKPVGECTVCGFPKVDRAHIKTRATGGTWAEDNIVLLCRRHHQMQHQKGWVYMWDGYNPLRVALKAKGWVVQDIFGVRKLVRAE